MIWKIFKEEYKYLHVCIDILRKFKIPYLSIYYLFIANVADSEMRKIIDIITDKQSTPQVNNAKLTKINSTLHKKLYLKIP